MCSQFICSRDIYKTSSMQFWIGRSSRISSKTVADVPAASRQVLAPRSFALLLLQPTEQDRRCLRLCLHIDVGAPARRIVIHHWAATTGRSFIILSQKLNKAGVFSVEAACQACTRRPVPLQSVSSDGRSCRQYLLIYV